jgi:hypothetical protein
MQEWDDVPLLQGLPFVPAGVPYSALIQARKPELNLFRVFRLFVIFFHSYQHVPQHMLRLVQIIWLNSFPNSFDLREPAGRFCQLKFTDLGKGQ